MKLFSGNQKVRKKVNNFLVFLYSFFLLFSYLFFRLCLILTFFQGRKRKHKNTNNFWWLNISKKGRRRRSLQVEDFWTKKPLREEWENQIFKMTRRRRSGRCIFEPFFNLSSLPLRLLYHFLTFIFNFFLPKFTLCVLVQVFCCGLCLMSFSLAGRGGERCSEDRRGG